MKTDWLLFVAGSPSTAGTEAPGVEWWRLLVLTLIFAVLFAIWWWVNRGKMNLQTLLSPGEKLIKVEEQRWLNSHSSIVLVQVGRERFLLAQNQHGVAWQKLDAPSSSTSSTTSS